MCAEVRLLRRCGDALGSRALCVKIVNKFLTVFGRPLGMVPTPTMLGLAYPMVVERGANACGFTEILKNYGLLVRK